MTARRQPTLLTEGAAPFGDAAGYWLTEHQRQKMGQAQLMLEGRAKYQSKRTADAAANPPRRLRPGGTSTQPYATPSAAVGRNPGFPGASFTGKTLSLPCVSTAFVAKTLLFLAVLRQQRRRRIQPADE